MPTRSLLFSAIILTSYSLATAQNSPAIPSPRYVGPMGANPTPSAFATPQASRSAFPLPAAKLLRQHSRKSTCYAIHSYTIKPESDTIGINHLSSETTCVAADQFSMKQTTQAPSGPHFQ